MNPNFWTLRNPVAQCSNAKCSVLSRSIIYGEPTKCMTHILTHTEQYLWTPNNSAERQRQHTVPTFAKWEMRKTSSGSNQGEFLNFLNLIFLIYKCVQRRWWMCSANTRWCLFCTLKSGFNKKSFSGKNSLKMESLKMYNLEIRKF